MKFQDLEQSYLDLIYTSFSPPISKLHAIQIALNQGGWNTTTLKDMVVTANLVYMKFAPITKIYEGNITWRLEGGIEILNQVTEPVPDYSPVYDGDITYRYIWNVIIERAGVFKTIPPPGFYYIDAASGEVIPTGILI